MYFGVKHDTVGEEGGFKPATFVSSRKNRASQQPVRSIRDFMDEDDGLLGGVLSAKVEVDAFAGQRGGMGVSITAQGSSSGTGKELSEDTISGTDYVMSVQRLLSNIVSQPTNSIGRKLLRQMGWREGQGIGPRVPLGRMTEVDGDKESVEAAARATLPTDSLAFAGLGGRGSEGDTLTFAPKDTVRTMTLPPSKSDFTGIGYRNTNRLFGDDNYEDEDGDSDNDNTERRQYRVSDLFQTEGKSKHKFKKNKTISGFGGLDDDDDAYDEDIAFGRGHASDRSKYYDYEDSSDDEKEKEKERKGIDNVNDNGQTKIFYEATLIRCPSDNRPPLPGYHVASDNGKGKGAIQFPNYPIPTVPDSFTRRPWHVFSEASRITTAQHTNGSSTVRWKINTEEKLAERASLWKDTAREVSGTETGKETESITVPPVPILQGKIFELLKPADRERIERLALSTRGQSQSVVTATPVTDERKDSIAPVVIPVPPLPPHSVGVDERPRPMLISQSLLNTSFATLSAQFKNRFTPATVSVSNVMDNTVKTEDNGNNTVLVKEGLATAEEYARLAKEKLKHEPQSLSTVKHTTGK